MEPSDSPVEVTAEPALQKRTRRRLRILLACNFEFELSFIQHRWRSTPVSHLIFPDA